MSPSATFATAAVEAQRSQAIYESKKAERLYLRARKFGRAHKASVFKRREETWEEDVTSLESELAKKSHTTSTAATTPSASESSTPLSAADTAPERAATATATATVSVKKKGVGYNTLSLTDALDIGWLYDWASIPGGTVPDGREFVPMLWGAETGDWMTVAQEAVDNGAKYLLGHVSSTSLTTSSDTITDIPSTHARPDDPLPFHNSSSSTNDFVALSFNEPDLVCTPSSCQSNLTVAEAIDLWGTNMEPFHKLGVQLVSPAVTNGGEFLSFAPRLLSWLRFRRARRVTSRPSHWRDLAARVPRQCDREGLPRRCDCPPLVITNYLTDAYDAFGLPIWLTEFAGSGTVAEQQEFFETVIPWMEDHVQVERYAAFGDFTGTFVAPDGSLTDLGATYSAA
ncbi:SPOSA6832_02756, partial [Sporobolomyces salmonicolor]